MGVCHALLVPPSTPRRRHPPLSQQPAVSARRSPALATGPSQQHVHTTTHTRGHLAVGGWLHDALRRGLHIAPAPPGCGRHTSRKMKQTKGGCTNHARRRVKHGCNSVGAANRHRCAVDFGMPRRIIPAHTPTRRRTPGAAEYPEYRSSCVAGAGAAAYPEYRSSPTAASVSRCPSATTPRDDRLVTCTHTAQNHLSVGWHRLPKRQGKARWPGWRPPSF